MEWVDDSTHSLPPSSSPSYFFIFFVFWWTQALSGVGVRACVCVCVGVPLHDGVGWKREAAGCHSGHRDSQRQRRLAWPLFLVFWSFLNEHRPCFGCFDSKGAFFYFFIGIKPQGSEKICAHSRIIWAVTLIDSAVAGIQTVFTSRGGGLWSIFWGSRSNGGSTQTSGNTKNSFLSR